MKSNLTLIFVVALFLIGQSSFAQKKELTGTVIDDDGTPLPGVNITITDKKAGTQTDFDGKFSLEVEEGDVLIFSYVGYTEITKTVGEEDVMDVTMKEGESLDQVSISTGYQNITERTSTKAVSKVSSEDIQNSTEASPLRALQGKVPGLFIGSSSGQPGESGRVILRGIGSFNGATNPIYIIDGVETGQAALRNLNSDDIEDINVLKGPSATAQYGNRGANGVIVIKTKSGEYNEKLDIHYGSQYGFSKMLPINKELMNSKERLIYHRDYLGSAKGFALNDAEIDALARATDTRWRNQFFQTGTTTKQNLRISQGSENLKSSTAFNFYDQDGVIKNSGIKRFSFQNKVEGKSDDDRFHYKSDIKASYSRTDITPQVGVHDAWSNPALIAYQGAPYLSPYDPDGSVTKTGGIDEQKSMFLVWQSPYAILNDVKLNQVQQDRIQLMANFHADWEFVKHFTAGVDVNANYQSIIDDNIIDPSSLRAPTETNDDLNHYGSANNNDRRPFRFETKANINYNNTFGDENEHTLNVDLFTEYHKNYQNSFGFFTGGLNDRLLETDQAYLYDTKENGEYVYVPYLDLRKSEQISGMFSYFALVDYDYNERFGFSGSIRRDASSRFKGSNKWATFWSVAGRWNLDAEDFLEDSFVDNLKLRISYGTSGNQKIGGNDFSALDLYKSTYSIYSDAYINSTGISPDVIGNGDLKWETNKQFDIGIDFGLWQNKIQGKLDFYHKKTLNLYKGRPVSPVFGTSEVDDNIGTVANKGFESYLKYIIFDNDEWTISVNGNFAYNRNKIKDLPSSDENGVIENGGGSLGEGRAIGEHVVGRQIGVNPSDGNTLYLDKDGNVTEKNENDDRVFSNKQRFPEIKGGFGADISYKGFTLSQKWVYTANVYRNNYDVTDLESEGNSGGLQNSTSMFRSWQDVGQITDIPRISTPNQAQVDHDLNDRFLQDASYLRLRNVSLSYTLNEEKLKHHLHLPLHSIKLYVQGDNLLTFTEYEGRDPESDGLGGDSVGNYPSFRTFSVGLDVNF